MTNHAEITQLLKQFSGQARILTIPRAYIDILNGNHLTALLLSQAVFLSDRAADDDGWFAMSYADWTEMLAMSEYQVRQGAKALASFGLETALRRSVEHEMAATLHYRVNMDVLTARILEVLRTRSEETSERRSEETSERSYMYEIKEREDTAENAEENLPDHLTPAQRKVIQLPDVPRPQPDGGAQAFAIVEAYADAWDITTPRYRDNLRITYRKPAEQLASMGATPDEVAAMCKERRARGKQPDEVPLTFLARDYVSWKSRPAAAPTAAGSFWGRDLTDGE